MVATFSLALPEEVVHVRDWVHEFAESVIRPAAAEWDEREVPRGRLFRRPRRWACAFRLEGA
jgi:alkylation response protein AidB-like acyl-CoA dehydrogenase